LTPALVRKVSILITFITLGTTGFDTKIDVKYGDCNPLHKIGLHTLYTNLKITISKMLTENFNFNHSIPIRGLEAYL